MTTKKVFVEKVFNDDFKKEIINSKKNSYDNEEVFS